VAHQGPFDRDDRLLGRQRRCLVGFDVEVDDAFA
jgi:hypothetical protein